DEDTPIMSNNLMRAKVFPHVQETVPTIMLLLDNFRYDQWKVIEPIITELFKVEEEDIFCSILPTSTQYSRNSIFSGLMPIDIQKRFPKMWVQDHEEGGKN